MHGNRDLRSLRYEVCLLATAVVINLLNLAVTTDISFLAFLLVNQLSWYRRRRGMLGDRTEHLLQRKRGSELDLASICAVDDRPGLVPCTLAF